MFVEILVSALTGLAAAAWLFFLPHVPVPDSVIELEHQGLAHCIYNNGERVRTIEAASINNPLARLVWRNVPRVTGFTDAGGTRYGDPIEGVGPSWRQHY